MAASASPGVVQMVVDILGKNAGDKSAFVDIGFGTTMVYNIYMVSFFRVLHEQSKRTKSNGVRWGIIFSPA